MAKRGRPKKIGSVPKAKKGSAKPNGQEALQAAEREIPPIEEAWQALKVLADMNDTVKALEALEAKAKSDYGDAKEERERAQKLLGEKLWQVTHKPALPLFNQAEAEADLQQIQEAASAPAAESVLEGAAEAPSVPPLALPDAEPIQTATEPTDASEPF